MKSKIEKGNDNNNDYSKAMIKKYLEVLSINAKIFQIGRSIKCDPPLSIFWLKNSAQGRINSTLVLDQKEDFTRNRRERKVHL